MNKKQQEIFTSEIWSLLMSGDDKKTLIAIKKLDKIDKLIHNRFNIINFFNNKVT